MNTATTTSALQEVRNVLKYHMNLNEVTISDYLARQWPDSVKDSIQAVYEARPSDLTQKLLIRVTGRPPKTINRAIWRV